MNRVFPSIAYSRYLHEVFISASPEFSIKDLRLDFIIQFRFGMAFRTISISLSITLDFPSFVK